jgi:hypothetical protein
MGGNRDWIAVRLRIMRTFLRNMRNLCKDIQHVKLVACRNENVTVANCVFRP